MLDSGPPLPYLQCISYETFSGPIGILENSPQQLSVFESVCCSRLDVWFQNITTLYNIEYHLLTAPIAAAATEIKFRRRASAWISFAIARNSPLSISPEPQQRRTKATERKKFEDELKKQKEASITYAYLIHQHHTSWTYPSHTWHLCWLIKFKHERIN